jgi:hypothetical protein
MAASFDEKRHSNTPGDASSLADEKQQPQPLNESQAPTESGSVMQDVSPAKGGEEEEVAGEKKDEEPEYVTGFKLALMVGSVTLACFLMLLDISIIVTVSNYHHPFSMTVYLGGEQRELTDGEIFNRLFLASPRNFTRFKMLVGTEVPTTWHGKFFFL